jgi:hypothetical protein
VQANRTLWIQWARILQRWKLDGLVAYLLEAGGPFVIIATQFIYIGQPFLHQALPGGQLQALIHLLEDQEEGQMFVEFLREAKSR